MLHSRKVTLGERVGEIREKLEETTHSWLKIWEDYVNSEGTNGKPHICLNFKRDCA